MRVEWYHDEDEVGGGVLGVLLELAMAIARSCTVTQQNLLPLQPVTLEGLPRRGYLHLYGCKQIP